MTYWLIDGRNADQAALQKERERERKKAKNNNKQIEKAEIEIETRTCVCIWTCVLVCSTKQLSCRSCTDGFDLSHLTTSLKKAAVPHHRDGRACQSLKCVCVCVHVSVWVRAALDYHEIQSGSLTSQVDSPIQ